MGREACAANSRKPESRRRRPGRYRGLGARGNAARKKTATRATLTTRAGREFVVRPFTPSMSLKTATTLSADWHEAVANNLDGPNSAFPDPWYPAARLGDYEILPIEDGASLYREGTAMHHCVGTYGDRVQCGNLYIYSIRRNGERVATLALGRHNGRAYVEQIRGPCNTEPPKAIVATVARWLHAQQPLPPHKAIEATPGTDLKEVAA